MRKCLSALAACIIWGLVFCPASTGEGKVGYIDIQRLVNESKMGVAAKKEIEKLQKEKEAVLASKLKEISILKEKIDENQGTMDVKEKEDKAEALKVLHKEYQNLVKDAKEDILKEDGELISTLLQKADGILKKIAKKRKFSIILKNPNSIGYLDPQFDITDMVLKELNESEK